MAARWPHPAFDLAACQTYNPPLPPGRALLAALLFGLVLGGTSILLWQAHELSAGVLMAGALALVGTLCWVSSLTQPRVTPNALGKLASTP